MSDEPRGKGCAAAQPYHVHIHFTYYSRDVNLMTQFVTTSKCSKYLLRFVEYGRKLRKPLKRRWKILIGLAVVVFAFAAIWIIPHWVKVVAYRRMLLANGEKLEIGEVMPAPVPPEENGADVIKKASAQFVLGGYPWTNMSPAMLLVAPGKAVVCFQQSDVRESDFTNSWSNVRAFMESNRPATESLRQIMKYPAIDFHLDYSSGMEMLLTNLSPLKLCVQMLSSEAICDLHRGDTASATTNVCAMLSLADDERDERTLISQLVRMVMARIAAGPTWELLQTTNLNDVELAALQKSWERLEYIHAAENALLMERAGMESDIRRMRTSQKHFNDLATMGLGGPSNFVDSAKLVSTRYAWHYLWSYPDELRALEGDQAILQAFRSVQTNQSFYSAYTNMSEQFANLGIPLPEGDDFGLNLDIDLPNLFSRSTPNLATAVYRAMAAEATKQTVVAAIALKRYQLKHGNYPSDLTALVPEFVSSVPRDPVDGKPLRYRRNTDGTFLLYSIGFNGRDDGGDPALEKGSENPGYFDWPQPHSLDWVWPQPATPKEIQYYYTHRPPNY